MTIGVDPASCATNQDMLSICIVNNMSGAALQSTERQFRAMIGTAAGERRVALRFFSLPDYRRDGSTQAYIRHHYEDLASLLNGDCDGLIVTGAEPRADLLPQEPFWPALSELIEWARDHTNSAVFLCLAAHAAVLHLDGIRRYRLPKKISGVFESSKARDDKLLAGCPEKWIVPHSRSNDLMESDLVARGYSILSRSLQIGADIFTKPSTGRSEFIFMQGHLEYDTGALLGEYRREVKRFFNRRRTAYPELPVNYFDTTTERQLLAFREQSSASLDVRSIEALPLIANMRHAYSWEPLAIQIYSNWIADLALRKASMSNSKHNGSARDALVLFK